MMNTWLIRRSVRRPVSFRTTSAISSSVCRLPFIRASASPLRTISTALAAEAWLCGASTRRYGRMSSPNCPATARTLAWGPTRIGRIRSASAASSAAVSDDSSHGCATAVVTGSSSAQRSISAGYTRYSRDDFWGGAISVGSWYFFILSPRAARGQCRVKAPALTAKRPPCMAHDLPGGLFGTRRGRAVASGALGRLARRRLVELQNALDLGEHRFALWRDLAVGVADPPHDIDGLAPLLFGRQQPRESCERALLVEAQHERLLLGGGPHPFARQLAQHRVLLLDALCQAGAAGVEHVLGLRHREHDAQHGFSKAALLLAGPDCFDFRGEQLLGVLVAGARLSGVGVGRAQT